MQLFSNYEVAYYSKIINWVQVGARDLWFIIPEGLSHLYSLHAMTLVKHNT